MASNICSSCLRSLIRQDLRKQSPAALRPTRFTLPPTRAFASSTHRRAAASEPPPSHPPPRDPKPLSRREQSAVANFAASLRSNPALRSTTEPYAAYGATDELFRECARQCDYTIPGALKKPREDPPRNAADEHVGEGTGMWFAPRAQGGLGLDVTFNVWAQVIMLHMWMLTARLRSFPREHVRIWHQHLLDHFFYAAEDRMVMWHNLSSRGTRNKYLKDLLMQWRGILLSYDEGLIQGDAVLATAIWRNIFKAKEDVSIQDLAAVTAYVRREMQMLDRLPDETLATKQLEFGSLKDCHRLAEA